MSLKINDETGAVSFGDTIVGEFDASENRLILNLAWSRLAGLKLTVQGDPKSDRRRILFARPAETKRLEAGDQGTLDEHLDGDTKVTLDGADG